MPMFAKQQFEDNRCGLGWDKPAKEQGGPTSDYASPETFGHTGFTGTAVWVDPESELVYVFLSNNPEKKIYLLNHVVIFNLFI